MASKNHSLEVIRAVSGVLAVTSIVFATACSGGTGADTPDPNASGTATATETAVDSPDPSIQAETTTETVKASTTSEPDSGQSTYIRIDQSTYDIGLPETESAVFTSGDGTIHCTFTAEHGQYNFPQRMFEIDETVGGCVHGEDGEFVSINTDGAMQPAFVEELPMPEREIPDAPATLDTGEFVHLGHLGCYAPDTGEIACTKFETGQAFMISDNGFRELTNNEVMTHLTNPEGQVQVLSRIIDLPFGGGEGVRCFHESAGDPTYSCMSLDPAGWDSTEGPGPANIIAWELTDGGADFSKAFAANPGMNIYESRQPLKPGSYILDSGVVAAYDGSEVTFTTENGDSFWTNGPEYGTAKVSG